MAAASPVTSAAARSSLPRVISLLPAAAEILSFIGAEHLLVARGHEDDFPPSIQSLPVVTSSRLHFTTSADVDKKVSALASDPEGLYSLDADVIRALQPDVIITQGLCTVCAVSQGQVHRLAKIIDPPPKVIALSPTTVADVIADLITVGKAVGLEQEASAAASSLQRRVDAATQLAARQRANGEATRVAFLEWLDPVFCGGHWTAEIIEMAGGVQPVSKNKSNGAAAYESVRISTNQITEFDPEWIIVCPCGLDLPLTRRELSAVASKDWWQSLRAVREGRVVLVDGNQMFNRSGPRVVDALEWMVGLLNDKWTLMPLAFPWEMWGREEVGAKEGQGGDEAKDAGRDMSVEQQQGGGGAAEGAGRAERGVSSQEGSSEEPSSLSTPTPILVGDSRWCQPSLPVEVEEAHQAACSASQMSYRDPATGYSVFTAAAMTQRGVCCGNKCRHCPFGHFGVPNTKGPRLNTISRPTFLTSAAVDRKMKAALPLRQKHAGGPKARGDKSTNHASASVGATLLQWDGSLAALSALKEIKERPNFDSARLSFFSFFHPSSGHLLRLTPLPKPQDIQTSASVQELASSDPQDPFSSDFKATPSLQPYLLPISLRGAMDHVNSMKLPLLAIPSPSEDVTIALKEGLEAFPYEISKVVLVEESLRDNLLQLGTTTFEVGGKDSINLQSQELATFLVESMPKASKLVDVSHGVHNLHSLGLQDISIEVLDRASQVFIETPQ